MFLASGLLLAGVILPLLIPHWGGNMQASIYTFVLCIGAAGVFLFFRRRAAGQESEPAIASLFGGESILSVAAPPVADYEASPLPLPRQSENLAPVLEMPAPVVAELQIEYSHNDCDSPRLRNKPLLLRNATPGSDACNVRIRPVAAPQNTLIFEPEVITRISGGAEVEIVPQYEQRAGESPRTSVNQLPDFIGGFYNPGGHTDLKALNEIYEEKLLVLEIEYESAGKDVVTQCELLYTHWHRNIRMGRQEIQTSSPVERSS